MAISFTYGLLHRWLPSASVLPFVFMVNGLDSATVDGASHHIQRSTTKHSKTPTKNLGQS